MVFFPVQTFSFTPNQKQTFFPSQAKEQANFFFPIVIFCTPIFGQFCEQICPFSTAEQTMFSSLLLKSF